MSDLEHKLVETARAGEWATFSVEIPTLEQEGSTRVPASLIRKLLLGLRNRRREPLPAGIRLRGAILEGTLDLTDCCGSEGQPLPPLLLDRCILLGHSQAGDPLPKAIDARHAHLSRLSLTRCRILGCVDLTDSKLGGDLEIDEIAPVHGDAPCQVSASKCRIDGSLHARSAHLRIPLDQKIPDFDLPDYALYLANAEIKGSLVLQPGFRAEGGINVRGARVGGDIWAEGAQATSEAVAFRAQALQCNGTVALRGVEAAGKEKMPPSPCQMTGQVDFLDATLGFLDLRGIHIGRPLKEVEPGKDWALTLALTRVRGFIWLQSFSALVPTLIEGRITLQAATVGGDLNASTLQVTLPDSTSPALWATDLRVGGNVYLGDLTASITLDGSHIEHDLVATNTGKTPSGTDYSLSARNAQIGNNCRLSRVSGTLSLELVRIGGALTVDAADLANLNAKDAEVRGSVLVQGSFRNWQNVAWKDHPNEVQTSKDDKDERTLRFDGGSYGEFAVDIEFRQLGDTAPILAIEDARIERDLYLKRINAVRLEDWAQSPPVAVLAAPAPFYPGWTLVEAVCSLADGRQALVAFLTNDKDETILLTGKSQPIHQLNGRKLLSLGSEAVVRDYLRFFCAYVWGAEGAFRIIEDEAVLNGLKPAAPARLGEVSLQEEVSGKGWTYKATVQYGMWLFQSILRVEPTGMVVMTEDTPLAELKGAAAVTFLPPLRVLNSQSGKVTPSHAFWIPSILRAVQPKSRPLADVESDLRLLSRKNEDKAPVQGSAIVSLQGLKAGALRYAPVSGSLGKGVQLKLEGFHYDRFEDDRRDRPAVAFTKAEGAPRQRTWLLGWISQALWRRRIRKAEKQEVPAPVFYESWLAHQFIDGKPRKSEYAPQPYEQLARVLRNSGDSESAKAVVLKKLALERKLIHPFWAKPGNWCFEKLFHHGLFARRSVILFAGLLLGGWAMFELANQGRIGRLIWPVLDSPVLVVDSVAVSPVLLRRAAALSGDAGPAMAVVRTPREFATEAPCGSQIDSFWYALDVLVPLLDLRQEEKCTISSRGEVWGWRAFKSLYAVAGAVVTSMMLLTLSGVLRRRVEQ